MEANHHTPSTSSYILLFIFSFASAVALSSTTFISPLVSLLIIFVGLAALLGEKIHNYKISKEVLFLSLALIALGLGALRYAVKDFHELVVPETVGVVVSEPEDRDNFRRFVLVSDNGERVLVQAPLYSPVQYGDRVEVEGKLERPGVIEDIDGGRPFDYGRYLSKDDIYYTLSFTEVVIISSGHGNLIKAALLKLKSNFVGKIREILTEPQASLLAGLIVAGRDAMPRDILEEFRRAGVIHIVVLSGFNVTLIAEFMRKGFQSLFIHSRLPASPRVAAGAAIAGIILFVIMTGAEATVVRAAIMALTVVAAKLFGRNYSASRALLLAGFAMVLHNPKILAFDPSFQLSFLATLGLIYLMPVIDAQLGGETAKLGSLGKLREVFSQTLATQLAVLPALIYMMGDVSLVSLPANMLVLLIIPLTMLVGFLAVLVSYISIIIAWPLSFASHLLLSWILFVSSTLGNLSFASIAVPPIPAWLVISVYLLAIVLLKFSSTLAQFKLTKKSSM
jgi:competence protein ComEC